MTILYRPVPIETVEQAEALPIGTVVTGTRCGVIEKGSRGHWWAGLAELPDRIAVGGAALVPIEAEEEWTPMVDGHAYVNGKKSEAHVRATVAEWTGAATGHRLVTPWEEA